MEKSLQIKEVEEFTSIEEFESEIEPLNVPLVFRGCVKDWEAFRSWNPKNGGLDYLQERAESAVVEVMLSRSAPIFYGDIRSHDRVPLPFPLFIELCKRGLSKDDRCDDRTETEVLENVALDADLFNSLSNARGQLYLAQVPILNRENSERVKLESLQEDIKVPSFLGSKDLSSINLWMNNAESRSSTHYDPHHNLLCVVAGCKQVVLWPPSAGPLLYPMPIHGEASNHSSVALDALDFSLHPRFEGAYEFSQKVVLQAGDGLFIPEGWFHQVDSDQLTIAVNFWWRSNVVSSMLEHMDAYYLRIILRRLIDKEMVRSLFIHNVIDEDMLVILFNCLWLCACFDCSKVCSVALSLMCINLFIRSGVLKLMFTEVLKSCSSLAGFDDDFILLRLLSFSIGQNQMLQKTCGADFGKMRSCRPEAPDNGKADSQGNVVSQKHDQKLNLNVKLPDLGPPALEALHELVSLVHDGVNDQQCSSTSDSRVISDRDNKNTMMTKSDCSNTANQQDQCTSKSDSGVLSDKDSKNDSIPIILWKLEPLDLLRSFLAMVHSFPRTLEALILHMLSPLGAEVLTRKFDELDQLLTEEDRSAFYQRFYSVFDDQYAIMDVILKGKESFSLQAFKNVLQLYMGVTLGGSSYTLG